MGKFSPEIDEEAVVQENKNPEPVKESISGRVVEKKVDGLSPLQDFYKKRFADYGSEKQSPNADLQIIADAYASYESLAKNPDAIPTEGNRGLLAALTGENKLGIKIFDLNNVPVNEKGEILDRWKTPLYFHFISEKRVGIRSAGLDRKWYTADDITNGIDAEPLNPE